MRRWAIVLLAFATACGSGGAEPEPPPTPAVPIARVVSGDQQHATVNSALANSLVTQVLDSAGHPWSNMRVTFLPMCNLTVSANFVQSDQEGRAAIAVSRMPTQAGPCTVQSGIEGVTQVAAVFTLYADADVPVTLRNPLNGTDLATGFAGHVAPGPPSVQPFDQFGNPVPGVGVTWRVTAGGGSVTPAIVPTGPDGISTPVWTLGPTRGKNKIEGSVTAIGAIEFAANAVLPGPGHIALTSGFYAPHTTLQTMNPDGSGLASVPGTIEGDDEPDWFPSGTRLAFLNYAANPALLSGFNPYPDIVAMNTNGTGRVRLTDHFADSLESPTVSPDGTHLAFAAFKGTQWEIFAMSSTGGTPTQLTTAGGMSPTWSPDGTKLAFLGHGLCTIGVNGTGLSCSPIPASLSYLTRHLEWSPDGSRIALSQGVTGDACGRLGYIMRLDGSELVRVGGGHQSWSPDGSKLVFELESCTHGQVQAGIGSADVDTTLGPTVVGLTMSTLSRSPSWGP